jgi:threonine dehydrogenase-like Zn-dependent dehydrogenase
MEIFLPTILALASYGRGKVMSIRIDDIHINNLHVAGAGNNWNMHKKAAELMADNTINIECFVTHTLRLEEFEKVSSLPEKDLLALSRRSFYYDYRYRYRHIIS